MTRIKLCGLKRPCDITYANQLMPDYIGFVFAAGSRRYVTPEQAKALRKELHPDIVPVGVFVNEEPEVIVNLLQQNIISAVQLHGPESPEYIENLRRHTDCTIIKAFSMKTMEDAEAANESPADMILLDSGSGGTGEPFDWKLLSGIHRPYFLAGGLTPENAGEAIAACRPYGVDVSSSLETEGYKDIQKMTAFVNAVRERILL